MPTQLDTITDMRKRTLLQIDVRTPELKKALQDYANDEGITVAALIFDALINQHPELAKTFGDVLVKSLARKPERVDILSKVKRP